ncbi:MAG: hypothetical protein E6R08_00875 [Nevskiaceae bacterium]|nr:MAG: hypothetical protein E6R08_00875 [Nevskiaceae bacterium]
MMKNARPLAGLRAGRTAQITASGPHELPKLTADQFRSALTYVAQAAVSCVKVPEEFFPVGSSVSVIGDDDSKRTLLALYAHFKSNGSLACSAFYRYRGMALLARNELLRPWVMFDVNHDNFAGYHSALVQVLASLPMNSKGHFDPEAARTAALEISSGFPDYAPPALPGSEAVLAANATAANTVDRRVAA